MEVCNASFVATRFAILALALLTLLFVTQKLNPGTSSGLYSS